MADNGDDTLERHRQEALRARREVESLVQQARALLHGDAASRQPRRPSHAKGLERERELEATLEKIEWYRREVKRLRQEVEGCYDARVGIGNGPGSARERDPMELQNLITEKRKELDSLRKSGEGLDRIAEAQRRAEAAQNSLSPEIQEKLARTKADVEQEKRSNVKLQAERQKVCNARKKADEEVRAAGGELRNKAAELRRPAAGKPGDQRGGASGDGQDAMVLKQLQRDMDILREAVRQDDRKFKSAQRELEQETNHYARQVATLRDVVSELEAQLAGCQGSASSPKSLV
mmetsp:Transcript_9775/g.25651  ORF Transcript_9775/g.25651 Transcript_9775/m.25651 type:complete len:292 (+) Transcript_9775:70-945(+)